MARRTKKATRKKVSKKKASKKKATSRRKTSTGRKKTTRKKATSAVRRRSRSAPGEELTLGAWRVPKTLLERLNAASYWGRVSAASIVREALDSALVRLEKKNGTKFPMPPRRR